MLKKMCIAKIFFIVLLSADLFGFKFHDASLYGKHNLKTADKNTSGFHAYYTRFNINDAITGKYADVIVSFGDKGKFVFSRSSSYRPYWETAKGKWYVDEIIPRKGNGTKLQPDKHNGFSYSRIIKNDPGEIIIQWRNYPDIQKIGLTDVVHEFCTITPDDVMNLKAVYLADLKGDTASMDFTNGIPKKSPLPDANIELINMKSDCKVFLAFQEGAHIKPWGNVPVGMYCHFMTWNHWPVSFITSQGKSSLFPDRVTHSASIGAADDAVDHGNMAMYGFTNKPIEDLIPLVKSWNNPPSIGKGLFAILMVIKC
jgi:hypothetical protein